MGPPAGRGRPDRTTIIYDGDCPLCRGSVAWIRTRDRTGAFDFVPFQQPGFEGRFPQVPRAVCEAGVTLVRPDGSVASGADALPDVLRELPRWRRLAPVLGARALRPLARCVYNRIASHRLRDVGAGRQS